ncbi:MAG: type IV secretion system DNA-binding domain-containing protein [Candidatus Paracaedibacter sp.]
MFKKFIGGGQVTMHNVSMIRQVLNVTFIATLIVGALAFASKSWLDYTPYERSAALAYYWADFKANIPLVRKEQIRKMTQNYTYEDGTSQVVYSIHILNDKWHQNLVQDINDQLIKNSIFTLWFMLVFFVVVCAGWVWRGAKIKEKKILSGTEEVTGEYLAKLVRRSNVASDLILAEVPLIKNSEVQHTLIIGTTGSGKTNCLHELLQQIRRRKQRAIIVDMTGVFIEKYYRPGIDKILNPRDQRSEAWSIWGECQDPAHFKTMASLLIPANGHGEETYWITNARVLFDATAKKLREQGRLTNKNFLEVATDEPVKEIQKFYKGTKAAAIVNADGKETVMGVRSHLRGSIDSIELFEDTEQPFSIRDWVKADQGEGWLFLSSHSELREELSVLLSLWTSIATEAINSLSRDLERRIWVVIDELPAIKKLPTLHTMLAEVRQRGGSIIIGAQDMSLLDQIYGQNLVKSIANLCSTKVVFRIEGAEIAERMSKWLGVQEVSESIENISYGQDRIRDGVSLNDNRKEKPTVHFDKLMKLPNLEAYLKLPGSYPIAKIKFKIHDLPKVSEGFIPLKL